MYQKRVDVSKSVEEKLQESTESDDCVDNKSIINKKWLDANSKENLKRTKHQERSRYRHHRERKENWKKDLRKNYNIFDLQSQVDIYVNITSDDSIEDNANCDYEDNANDSDTSSSRSSDDNSITTSSSSEENMESDRKSKNVNHEHYTKEINNGKLEKKMNIIAENFTNKENANVRLDDDVCFQSIAATNAEKNEQFILTSWEECSHKSTSVKRKGEKLTNTLLKSSNLFKKLWHENKITGNTSSESNETNVEQEWKMSESISSELLLSIEKNSLLENKCESQLRTNDKSYTSPLSIECTNSKQDETKIHRKRENGKEAELHMSDKEWIHVRDSSENSKQYVLGSDNNINNNNSNNNNRNNIVSITTRSMANNKEEQECQPIERLIQEEFVVCNLPSNLSNRKAKSDNKHLSTRNYCSDLFKTVDNATNSDTANFPSMQSIYSPFASNTITQKRNSHSNNCIKYYRNMFINDYNYDNTEPELYSKKAICNSNNELERNASKSYNLTSVGMNSMYNNRNNSNINSDNNFNNNNDNFNCQHLPHSFGNVISGNYGEPLVEKHNRSQTESVSLHQLSMYAVSNQDDKDHPFCSYSRPSSSECSSFNESSVSSIGPTGLPESISSFRWIPFNGGCGYNPFMQHCEDNTNVDEQNCFVWKEYVQENNYEFDDNDHNMIASSLQEPPPLQQQQRYKQQQREEEVENYKQNGRQTLLKLVKNKKDAQLNHKSSDVNKTEATTIDEVVLYPFYGPVGFIGQEASRKREEWEYKHGACGLTEKTYIFSAMHPQCNCNDLSTQMENSNNDDNSNISLMTRMWCDTDVLENAPRIVSPVWEDLYNEEVNGDDGNNNNNNNNINNTTDTFADKNKNNNFTIAINDDDNNNNKNENAKLFHASQLNEHHHHQQQQQHQEQEQEHYERKKAPHCFRFAQNACCNKIEKNRSNRDYLHNYSEFNNKLAINDDKVHESRQRRLTLPSSSSQKLNEEKKNEHVEEEEDELYDYQERNVICLDDGYNNEDESANDQNYKYKNYRENDKKDSVYEDEDEDEDEDSDDYNENDNRKINNVNTKNDFDTYSMIVTTSPDRIHTENIGELQLAEELFPLEISKKSIHQTLPKILEPHPPFSSRRKTLQFNTLSTNYRFPEINLTSSTSNTHKNCQTFPPLPPRED